MGNGPEKNEKLFVLGSDKLDAKRIVQGNIEQPINEKDREISDNDKIKKKKLTAEVEKKIQLIFRKKSI